MDNPKSPVEPVIVEKGASTPRDHFACTHHFELETRHVELEGFGWWFVAKYRDWVSYARNRKLAVAFMLDVISEELKKEVAIEQGRFHGS